MQQEYYNLFFNFGKGGDRGAREQEERGWGEEVRGARIERE